MFSRSQKIESFKSIPQSEKPIVLREIAKSTSRGANPQCKLRISYVTQVSRKNRQLNIASFSQFAPNLPYFKMERPSSQETSLFRHRNQDHGLSRGENKKH